MIVADLGGDGLGGLFGGDAFRRFGVLSGDGLEDLNGVLFGDSPSIPYGWNIILSTVIVL